MSSTQCAAPWLLAGLDPYCFSARGIAPAMRQKLQNLSHQLRVLQGDAELIRSASQAVQSLACISANPGALLFLSAAPTLFANLCKERLAARPAPRQGTRRRTKSVAPSAAPRETRRASAFDAEASGYRPMWGFYVGPQSIHVL